MKKMMSQSKIKNIQYILLLILVLGVLSSRVESLRFELHSFHSKCIAEQIMKDGMTLGKYHIVNETEGHPLPDSHKVKVMVSSSGGQRYHTSDNVTGGTFGFYGGEEGDYFACFFAPNVKPPIKLTIDFEWKSGIMAKDWSNVAKKGSVELMELELKKMFDIVQSVHDEMFYLSEREKDARALNIATTSKMAWLSLLSLALCISVAGLQFWHLKSFFEKKKII